MFEGVKSHHLEKIELVQFRASHFFHAWKKNRFFPSTYCWGSSQFPAVSVSIVLAGIAFFRPPPCNIAGRLLSLFFLLFPLLKLNYIGAISARPDFRYTNFSNIRYFCSLSVSSTISLFIKRLWPEPDFRYTNFFKAGPDFRYTNFFNLRRDPILGTLTFLC